MENLLLEYQPTREHIVLVTMWGGVSTYAIGPFKTYDDAVNFVDGRLRNDPMVHKVNGVFSLCKNVEMLTRSK